jgi:hypothetical protein
MPHSMLILALNAMFGMNRMALNAKIDIALRVCLQNVLNPMPHGMKSNHLMLKLALNAMFSIECHFTVCASCCSSCTSNKHD